MAKDLRTMNKTQLQGLGNMYNLTLSMELTKENMIKAIQEVQEKSSMSEETVIVANPITTTPIEETKTAEEILQEQIMTEPLITPTVISDTTEVTVVPVSEMQPLIQQYSTKKTPAKLICAICNRPEVTVNQKKYSLANYGELVCWNCQRSEEGIALKDKHKAKLQVKGEYTCITCSSVLNEQEVKYNRENKVKGMEEYCYCSKHHPKTKEVKKEEPKKKGTGVHCLIHGTELTEEELRTYRIALHLDKERLSNIPLCPKCLEELYQIVGV